MAHLIYICELTIPYIYIYIPIYLLHHMIFQMLSTLQLTDEQVEKSIKLEATFRQRVDNIAIKNEIALLEQFHLLSQCFQNSSSTAGVRCRQCEEMG